MANNRGRYEMAVEKGQEFNENKQWKNAVNAFRFALKEVKNEPEAYAGLGAACVGLKQYQRALDCYKLAARYSGGDVKYLNKVADIQERMGQLSDAGRTYMAAGEVLLRKRQVDAAIANWERAVRLESNLLGAHQRLAMVFQRKGQARDAVREYLAIARILDMQGQSKKALQMCRAAMRLDPDNPDILTAINLIKHGEEAYPDPEPDELDVPAEEEEEEEEDSIFQAVRQMASVLESEKESWQLTKDKAGHKDDPIAQAKELAQEQLAEEIFREEEDEDYEGGGMIKLERDALIGQGMDFESRGEAARAISSYEKAIDGGLDLPAVHFIVGLLHLQEGDSEKAAAALQKASRDETYASAVQAAMS